MRIGILIIIRCISAKYFHLNGNSFPLLVNGKEIQLVVPIHPPLIGMKRKKIKCLMIQMIDGLIILNLEFQFLKEHR